MLHHLLKSRGRSRSLNWAMALAPSLLLCACGGGGSDGGSTQNNLPSGGAALASEDPSTAPLPPGANASWLTFTPSSIDKLILQGQPMGTWIEVKATSTKQVSGTFNVAIVAKEGLLVPEKTKVTSISPMTYSAVMTLNQSLPSGIHTGNIEVRLCYDDPLVCATPVDGSPWRIPYRIEVIGTATMSYAGWEETVPIVSPSNYAGISQIGNTLVSVMQQPDRFSNGRVIETLKSTDGGSRWYMVPGQGPIPATSEFALVAHKNAVYLSGGTVKAVTPFTLTNHVWKFDGTKWTQRTPAAQFSPRKNQFMMSLGSDLFVISGYDNPYNPPNANEWQTGKLSDVWKSSDDGMTWTKVVDSVPAVSKSICAVAWNDALVIVTKDSVWSSKDGATWTQHPGTVPELSDDTKCAVMNGRLHVIGTSKSAEFRNTKSFSTSDLTTWRPEVQPTFERYDNAATGYAVVNNGTDDLLVIMVGGVKTGFGASWRTKPNPSIAQ